MSFSLPQLTYSYTALEPHVDAQTMQLHHSAHHQTYVTKLNDALKAAPAPTSDLISILQAPLSTAVRNNGGGHYNHSLFWQWMAPVGSSNVTPTASLKSKIDESFGSLDTFKQKFTDAALTRFGSGWAWLGVAADGSLRVTSTANQDNPLMTSVIAKEEQSIPILGLDVWEHAYYLKYQNRRAEYIQHFWQVVNWDKVSKDYEQFAIHGKVVPLA